MVPCGLSRSWESRFAIQGLFIRVTARGRMLTGAEGPGTHFWWETLLGQDTHKPYSFFRLSTWIWAVLEMLELEGISESLIWPFPGHQFSHLHTSVRISAELYSFYLQDCRAAQLHQDGNGGRRRLGDTKAVTLGTNCRRTVIPPGEIKFLRDGREQRGSNH